MNEDLVLRAGRRRLGHRRRRRVQGIGRLRHRVRREPPPSPAPSFPPAPDPRPAASGRKLPASLRRRALPWLLGAAAGVLALVLARRPEAGSRGSGGSAEGAMALPRSAAPALAAPTAVVDRPPTGVGIAAAPPATTTRAPGLGTAPAAAPAATALPSDPTAGRGSPEPASTSIALGYDAGAPCGRRTQGAIGAAEAEAQLDRFVAVEFAVLGSKDTGKVTFLNSHEPYQGHFYVAIFPDLYAAFPPGPAQSLRGRCVLVQGQVEAYRGVPQIVLRQASDLRDLGPAEAGAAAAGQP